MQHQEKREGSSSKFGTVDRYHKVQVANDLTCRSVMSVTT